MTRATNLQRTARHLTIRRSSATNTAEEEVEVECPLVNEAVLLQRCAFCEHGQGLLLDPSTNGLTLQCSFAKEG